ncbi:MAG: pyrimidine reductase family protein [Nocardioidaceae bacterium]
MRLVFPGDGARDTLGDDGLARAYAYPEGVTGRRPWVRANFVSTLDGAANGPDGRAGSINTAADRKVFGLLRALADVVLVGAGTARTEGYEPPEADEAWSALRERAGQPPRPAMAVVTRSGDIPPLLRDPSDDGEIFLVTCTAAPDQAVRQARDELGDDHVIVCGEQSADLAEVVDALAARGLSRILCEGGPHLMHDVAASGVLDELCLTLSPLMIGGEHPRIVAGPALDADLALHTLIEAEGSLLGRWTARAG